MKKFLSLMLGICFIIPCIFMLSACGDKDPKEPSMEAWDGTVIEVSEAVNNVITIETAEELAGLAKEVNEGKTFAGKTIKLTCDMDLAGKEWTPIGSGNSEANGTLNAGKRFDGIFDGQDHTIYNLKITIEGLLENDNLTSGVGLFGAIFDATIKNLEIENASVEGNHFVGVVVGHARGSVIEDVEVENASVSCEYLNDDESGDKAGVIVAFIGISPSNGSLVKNCSAEDCVVDADRDAGQLIGTLAILDISGTGTVNRAVQENNTVENVEVSCNESSSHVVGYTKSGQNIKNEIVGRVVDFTAQN